MTHNGNVDVMADWPDVPASRVVFSALTAVPLDDGWPESVEDTHSHSEVIVADELEISGCGTTRSCCCGKR